MFTRFRSLLHGLFYRSAFERDMDDELRFHVESRADDLAGAGLSRTEALRRARLEFGNPEAYQDRCRESRQLRFFDDLRTDIRFTLRSIRRDALLSATVIGTVALGIGATTAIFTVLNGVVLRPLPFLDPERLVMVGSVNDQGRLVTVFGPDFSEWQRECRGCEQVAAYSGTHLSNVTGGAQPERVRVGRVTENLFATMGIQPMLGRTFLPQETGRPIYGSSRDATPATAVILSHDLWVRRFGADASVVGKALRVEGDPCTIVGVMPRGFNFPGEAEAWIPATINPKRDNAFLSIVARLREGSSQTQVKAELDGIARRLNQEAPDGRRQTDIRLVPLHEHIVGNVRSSLQIFLAATGFVLLIACANVANLLLAQAATRPRELAVRAALGASRSRIVRQVMTESLTLSALGGACGFALATWLVRAFVALAPSDIPRTDSVTVDGWMLAFTMLVSLLTGLLFGLAPVARVSKVDVNASLQEGTARIGGSTERNRLRKTLVAAEVSLALVLLIGAGLLMKSLVQLARTPIGFDPSGTLAATVTLPEADYPTASDVKAYYQQALDRLGTLPDLGAVGAVSALPLGRFGARITGSLGVDGEPKDRPGAWARKLVAGGDYFRAAAIPLLKGRVFDERDRDGSMPVIIVSDALARRLWPNDDPIGRRLRVFGQEPWREVVGVVGDVKHDDIGERQLSAVYQPYLQVGDGARWLFGDMTFVLRTTGSPERTAPALRAVLAEVDKDLPVYDVTSFTQIVGRRVTDPRFYTLLLASFSFAALVLAGAGIYGLISYSVTQRTREIGIRVALGARPRSVLRLIVREGMIPVLIGTIVGVIAAFGATRVLSRFVYQVSVTDAATFTGLPVVLGLLALLACYLPARRATRVDPLTALRHE